MEEVISTRYIKETLGRLSGRCLLLLLFFLFMLLFVAYSAGILVLLKSTANINSLNELLDSRFDVGGLNDTWMRHYFQAPKTGVLRKLYLKKIYPNNYYEKIDGWEKIQEGNFAFFAPVVISYRYFIQNFTNYDICALQELDGFLSVSICFD
ncbi:hypothetical protein HUJ04_002967 [Dendroctonus ponderosae]|nr:hypothetical protein HUJ04_002967 [Dendroctonus ponderosae]